MKNIIPGIFFIVLAFTPNSQARADDLPASGPEQGSSIYFVSKAWQALREGDHEAVAALTQECVDRYGQRARQMQEKLEDFVTGDDARIRSQWALNDVATALFLQGKAYQNAGKFAEARESYTRLIREFKFGQCWDPKGWFWKPAEAAEENLAMIDKGVILDFGDYTSATLVARAWEALENEDFDRALSYTDKCIRMYENEARKMQSKLKDFPAGTFDEINTYWALNDVATAHFIKGQAHLGRGDSMDALREFEKVRQEYSFSQCWDPRGWFWKPAQAAGNWIQDLNEKRKTEDFLFKI